MFNIEAVHLNPDATGKVLCSKELSCPRHSPPIPVTSRYSKKPLSQDPSTSATMSDFTMIGSMVEAQRPFYGTAFVINRSAASRVSHVTLILMQLSTIDDHH